LPAQRRYAFEATMIELRDADSGAVLGSVTEAQLQFLIDQLEEESTTDQDYYFDDQTLTMLEDDGADPGLLALLRRALGGREGMEVRWSRA
jgi:processive 1,2-diacylglycerol beta-glucosyltransferase